MRTACATLVLVLAVAFVAGSAYAAAPAAAKEVKASVTGKIEVKMEKVADKEVKVPFVVVAEAKGADGKVIADLKGKTLKIVGPKVAEAEKLAGKEAMVAGVVKEMTIDATMAMEKKAPAPAPKAPAPAAPAPAAPAPAAPAK